MRTRKVNPTILSTKRSQRIEQGLASIDATASEFNADMLYKFNAPSIGIEQREKVRPLQGMICDPSYHELAL